MAKGANGQGAVCLRGDGRWETQLRLAGGGRNRSMGGHGVRSWETAGGALGGGQRGCQSVREIQLSLTFLIAGSR